MTVSSTYHLRSRMTPLMCPPADLSASSTSAPTITDAYALGNVTVSRRFGSAASVRSAAGGLIGVSLGSVDQCLFHRRGHCGFENVTPTVLGGSSATGDEGAQRLVRVYWDKDTSGLTQRHGHRQRRRRHHRPQARRCAHGRIATPARLARTATAASTSVSDGTWFMVDGQTRPFLRSRVVAHHPQHAPAPAHGDERWTRTMCWRTTSTSPASSANPACGARAASSPIGDIEPDRQQRSFTGSLNGQGFTINALMIAPNNATTQSVGLFGTIGATGSVSNLNFHQRRRCGEHRLRCSRSRARRSRSGSASSPARAAAPSPT